MSEYTHYFAVHGMTPVAIRDVLRAHRIISIVSDQAAKWKMPETWVPVAAPPDSGFRDGAFYSNSPWEVLVPLFPKVLQFWVDEQQQGWSVDLAHQGRIITLEISADSTPITPSQLDPLAAYFGVSPEVLAPTMKPGGAYPFSRLIGMPYLEMWDQAVGPYPGFTEKGYSLLGREVQD